MFEQYIGKEERVILDRIEETSDWSFSSLVRLSKLDPLSDFRFMDLRDFDFRKTDLRGFDFSYSDLRGALRDEQTIIDSSTILDGAQLEWVDIREKPIVEVMGKIEREGNRALRSVYLKQLVENYQSPNHINQFLIGMMKKTNSADTFILFAESLVENSNIEYRRSLRAALHSVILRRSRKSKGKKISGLSMFIASLIEQLNRAKNKELFSIYEEYIEKEYEEKNEISLDIRKYNSSTEMTRLLSVLES